MKSKKAYSELQGSLLMLLIIHLAVGIAGLNSASAQESAQDAPLRELWKQSGERLADTALGHRVQRLIVARIEQSGELEAPLPALQGMKDLLAGNRRLRVISWQHTLPMQRALYMAIIGYLDRHDSLHVVALRDRALPLQEGKIEGEWLRWQLPCNEWIGGAYYAVEPFAFRGEEAYMLLGLAGGDLFVQRRIVETLAVRGNGELVFGVPAIAYGRERLARLMFSCSARVSMTVHFYDKGRRVLIDHLSPPSPQYAGMAQYYGPDFSQDALVLGRDGMWVFQSDVIVANPKR